MSTATIAWIGSDAPPAGGNVTWTGTQNATVSAPHIEHSKAGYTMYANSVESISSDAVVPTYFQCEGACSTASGWSSTARNDLHLMLASGSPYTSETGYKLRVGIGAAGVGSVYKDGVYVTDFAGTTSLGDEMTVGFDGASHLQVMKNGSPLWTDGSTTPANDYILFIRGDNEETIVKWENVIYL